MGWVGQVCVCVFDWWVGGGGGVYPCVSELCCSR